MIARGFTAGTLSFRRAGVGSFRKNAHREQLIAILFLYAHELPRPNFSRLLSRIFVYNIRCFAISTPAQAGEVETEHGTIQSSFAQDVHGSGRCRRRNRSFS